MERNFLKKMIDSLEAKLNKYEKGTMIYSNTNIFKEKAKNVKIT
jgi:hypothetical protein